MLLNVSTHQHFGKRYICSINEKFICAFKALMFQLQNYLCNFRACVFKFVCVLQGEWSHFASLTELAQALLVSSEFPLCLELVQIYVGYHSLRAASASWLLVRAACFRVKERIFFFALYLLGNCSLSSWKSTCWRITWEKCYPNRLRLCGTWKYIMLVCEWWQYKKWRSVFLEEGVKWHLVFLSMCKSILPFQSCSSFFPTGRSDQELGVIE